LRYFAECRGGHKVGWGDENKFAGDRVVFWG